MSMLSFSYDLECIHWYGDNFKMAGKKKIYLDESQMDDCYSEFDDGKRIYDKDVAEFVRQHLSFFDRLNPRKVSQATLVAFTMLSNDDVPEGNWLFY